MGPDLGSRQSEAMLHIPLDLSLSIPFPQRDPLSYLPRECYVQPNFLGFARWGGGDFSGNV